MKSKFTSILSSECKEDFVAFISSSQALSDCILNILNSLSCADFKTKQDRIVISNLISQFAQLDSQMCQFSEYVHLFYEEVKCLNSEE